MSTASGETLVAVERLYLTGNRLTLHDVSWLSALASRARGLFVGANRLGDDGVSALAPVLGRNEGLTELAIGSNGIGAAGWHAVSDALRDHPSLRMFDASRLASVDPSGALADAIADESVFFLATLIRSAPQLQSISFDGRALSDASIGVLLDALFESRSIVHLDLQRRMNPSQRAMLRRILSRNRAANGPLAVPEDVAAIRSGYRTGRAAQMQAPRPKTPTIDTSGPVELSPEEIATAARVLNVLSRHPGQVFDQKALIPVRAGANRLVEAVRGESDARRYARSAEESRAARQHRKAHDESVVAVTGMRQMRLEAMRMLPGAPPEPAPVGRLLKPRHCYICKAAYFEVHAYYDSLCPACAALSSAKREQTADLRGRTALMTGGRIKIGYEAALKLLRAGARVVLTSRFPVDAVRRFAGEDDFEVWRERLQIHGIDLRDIRGVERFAGRMAGELDRLDILINNAAQTVRRPSDYYRHLLEAEARGPSALPPVLASVVAQGAYHVGEQPVPAAALTQIPLLPEDLQPEPGAFPLAVYDRNGQQKDLRTRNSWTVQVGQVATNEVLETHYVNAIAPFVLVNTLLPLMERTPGRKFIVNVSAMEGKFDYARKQETHPHTNMAKASLNMLTRTVAASLAERGIFMNSVDTGWVTNENPHELTERMRTNLGFEPPLDEVDGAARVLDPIFSAGESPSFGLFLKDYKSVSW